MTSSASGGAIRPTYTACRFLAWRPSYEPRFNQPVSETDPNGNTTDFIYDYQAGAGDSGRLVQITYPQVDDGFGILVRPVMKMTYNKWGQLESEIDPLGTITRYIYTQGSADEASSGQNPLFAAGVTPVPGLLTEVIRDYDGESLATVYHEFDGAGNPGLVIASPMGSPN